ncbi:hypothetical protein [Roseimaritima ulvae]|uniref:Uncharacterized protein n=1 Tax=Roseimaritima ulvae TaxID=980254 RepID=A0A5B9QIB6_9BACT|nr:hypothetical protein [Roseimaritima ulvae]QEG38614.1 hypothetical protein UC8_05710 [Roseimaritima ulvae]
MAAETHLGRIRAPSSHVFQHRAGSATDAAARPVGNQPASAEAGRRIDPPHHGGQRPQSDDNTLPTATAAPSGPATAAQTNDDAGSSLLHAHAEDLVHNLQTWAELLDRRESELHAAMALQENRERSFRLWSQSQQQQLQQLEREALRLREELKQQARRLALTARPDAIDATR